MTDREAQRELLEHHELESTTASRPLRIREAAVQLAMVLGWTAAVLAGLALAAVAGMAAWIAFGPRHYPSRLDSTRTDGQSVRSAAVMFVSEKSGGDCPGVEDLAEGGYLDRSRRTQDAWDHPFVIECDGDDIRVRSAGPDGRLGTEDDIQ